MQKRITHVAMDDSKHTIVAGILRPGIQEPEIRSLPNEPRQVRRFFTRLQREGPLRACYEAGPSGYDLYRQLTALDVPCQVIAPSLTPRKPGDRIKTDRRDAVKLVRAFRAGDLTPITVPDKASEAARDLVRCREAVQADLLRWRHRLVKFLARHGRVYRDGRHWTQRHWTWLRSQTFTLPALTRTYEEDSLDGGTTAGPRRPPGAGDRRPRRHPALPRPGGLAPVLPRDRYPLGDGVVHRGRERRPLCSPAAAHGV